jgi:hypothetical protein
MNPTAAISTFFASRFVMADEEPFIVFPIFSGLPYSEEDDVLERELKSIQRQSFDELLIGLLDPSVRGFIFWRGLAEAMNGLNDFRDALSDSTGDKEAWTTDGLVSLAEILEQGVLILKDMRQNGFDEEKRTARKMLTRVRASLKEAKKSR